MMGDYADYLTEQGMDFLVMHKTGECGQFGPCQYCYEEELAEQKQRAAIANAKPQGE